MAVLTAASPAAAQDMLIGVKGGGLFSQLSQPTDPVGEPTVLFGTSFTGFGFQVGGSFYRDLVDLGVGPLFVHADLMFAHQRASGFAESRTSPARRTVSINTTGLRLPALIGVGFRGGGTLLNLAAGPELLLGLGAASKTSAEGGAEPAPPLAVRPVTHVGLTAHVGMIFDVAAHKLPVDVRFTWDPFVASSTRDRFDNFVDFNNTGSYAVAFDWQAMVTTGVLFDLFGPKQDAAPMGEPVPVTEPGPAE